MRWRRRYEVIVEGESGAAISQRSVISEHRSERDAREAAAQERRRLEVIRAEEAATWVISVVRGDEVLHEERPFDGRRESVPASPLEPLRIRQAREPEGEPEATAPDAEPTREDEAPAPNIPTADADGASGTTGTMPALDVDADDHPAEAPPESSPTAASDADEPADVPAATRAPDAATAIGAPPVGDVDLDPAPEFAEGRRRAEPGTDLPEAEGATGRVRRTGDESAPPPARERRDADPVPSGPVPEEIIRRFEESIARERRRARERD